MPKGFSEYEKKLIAARLLEEGSKQFAAYGLKKTNVEELVAAAGISKGAFYLFFGSKEALFMDVVEEAEKRFRLEVLAAIDQPGPSPRARLFAVLKTAFSLWRTIPLLRFFTNSDYEIVARRVPPEKIEEHLRSDQVFLHELISRCQNAGIPIQAPVEQITGLVLALFFTSLHENDLGTGSLTGTVDILVELVAAFCLGEISIQAEELSGLLTGSDQGT